MKRASRIFAIVISGVLALSCSTTRVLQEDQYRLADNKIKVTNDKKFSTGSLTPYLKQKPNPSIFFGWNPFMSVYNWSNGKGKGWDKFVQRIGQAPVIYDAGLVESSVDNIMNHLEYQGYYGSSVETEVKVRKRKVSVAYNVTLGKRYPISTIEYVLPERGEFRTAFLQDTSRISLKPGDFLSEASLEAESERYASAMRNEGFFEFNKNHFFFDADTLSGNGDAALTVTVNEYTRNESPRDATPIRRYYLDNIDISYPENLNIRPKVLKDLTTLAPGQVYSEDAVNTTYSRLSALKIFSTVNIGMTPKDTNLVDCSITLSQSKLQGIKVNLEASSNSSGLFGISPQVSYYHKNIFRGGETLNLSFMGNFQFKFNDSVRSNEFGVSGGLSFPKFFPLPYRFFTGAVPRTDVNISYNYQNRPEYTRNIISTSYGYSGNVRNRFFYQAYPLQMNVVRLFDLDPDFYESLADDPFLKNAYQDHFDLGSGLMMYYTTDAESIPKSSFFYTRFQFDIAGNILSCFNGLLKQDSNGAGMIWNTPYSQFVRGEITLGRTWIFGRNSGQSIATRLLAGAGYAYGNSTALPFEKHFYAGGSNSLRGWQARTVGPGLSQMDKSFVIPNQTGDMRLEANIEYRFNMFWKVAGALFVDAGNVWTLRSSGEGNSYESMFRWDTFGESIAANWGAGLRLNFGFLLLRLDMGIKIHDPARIQKWVMPDQWFKSDGFAVHFGVGYPF
jgi:outer membrane protein assembly factor BamA